jgi:hypothetical protein
MNAYGAYPFMNGMNNPSLNYNAANAVNNILPGMGGAPIPPIGAMIAVNNAMGGEYNSWNPGYTGLNQHNTWNPNFNGRY